MKPRIYVDVDTQNDFCQPSGALFVSGADKALAQQQALLKHAAQTGALVVGSVDTHNFSAWEFEANGGPFPPHCVKGTQGWVQTQGTLPEKSVFVPNVNAEVELPEGLGAVYFEKEVYSLFANPMAESTIDTLLAGRGLARKDVLAVVFGVATDYCVKAAALGLRERGFEVTVVEDAVAAVSPETGAETMRHLEAQGCRLARTQDLLKEAT